MRSKLNDDDDDETECEWLFSWWVEVHGQWLKIYFAIQFNYICMYVCIISVNKYLVYDPRITRSLTALY